MLIRCMSWGWSVCHIDFGDIFTQSGRAPRKKAMKFRSFRLPFDQYQIFQQPVRQVSTQVGKFPLSGFTLAFKRACGWWSLKNEKIHSKYELVDPHVATELKKWGPKNIAINKKILKSLGYYSGPINTDIDKSYNRIWCLRS